jgi:hypothetical protein
MKFHKQQIAWLVACGIACLLLVAWWMRSYLHGDRFDAFEPRAGMTVEEVKAALGKPSWQYTYSDSGDPIPGERFRTSWELGYGELRVPAPKGGTMRKHRLLLRFEGWRVWDKADRLVEDHPLQLDSWERNAPR